MKYVNFIERFFKKRSGVGASLKYILKQVPEDSRAELLQEINKMVKAGKLQIILIKSRKFVKLK